MGGLAGHASPPGLASNYLRSATTLVNVSSAAAPTVGQVLTATGDSAATWQTTSSSGVSNLIDATNAAYGVSTSNTAAQNATAFGLANTAAVAAGKWLYIPSSSFDTAAVTITAPIADTMGQMFATTAAVTIDNGLPVRPEWFGSAAGNIKLAVDSLPSTGGVVQLELKRYLPSYTYGHPSTAAGTGYLAKQNVRLQGRKLPEYKTDNTGLEDGSGTIINGLFAAFADGFEWADIGVDSGSAVYGATAYDAFAFFQPDQTLPNTLATGVRIESVRGIGSSRTAATHGVLIEGINGGYVGYAEGSTATHGVVIKCQNMQIETLVGHNAATNTVILKSNNYSPLGKVTVDQIIGNGAGTGSTTHGVFIQGYDVAGGKITIGRIQSYSCANAVSLWKDTYAMTDIEIGEVIFDTVTTGIYYKGAERTNIGSVIGSNCTDAVFANSATTSKSNYIGRLLVKSATNAVKADGCIHIGDLSVDTVSGYAMLHNAAGARIMLSGIYNNIAGSATVWGMTAALANSWANYAAGSSSYSIIPHAGKVLLSGTIASGTAANISTALSAQIRPAETLRFPALGYDGTNWTPIELQITSAGVISAVNYTAASTWLSLDGISYPIPY